MITSCRRPEEVIFTRGATESINLVAQAYARPRLSPGDEVLITHMEHHSNIVPWQLVCEQTGAHLKVVPINEQGELEMDAFHALLTDRTKLMGLVHISNALGTVNPIEDIICKAHKKEIPVLVDGAQGAPHSPVNVQALDVDFYVFPDISYMDRQGLVFSSVKNLCLRRCLRIKVVAI